MLSLLSSLSAWRCHSLRQAWVSVWNEEGKTGFRNQHLAKMDISGYAIYVRIWKKYFELMQGAVLPGWGGNASADAPMHWPGPGQTSLTDQDTISD